MNTYIPRFSRLVILALLLMPGLLGNAAGALEGLAPRERMIVAGPGAAEAVSLVGGELVVDTGVGVAAALLSRGEAEALRSLGYLVAPDPVVSVVEPVVSGSPGAAAQLSYADLIGASILHQQGITGRGVIVAVVDTGVDEARPELGGAQVWEFDATGTGQSGYCGKGLGLQYSAHGTMVAGIIFSSDPRLLGVAPDAKLYDVIITRPELLCGGAYLSDIYNGVLAAARGPDGQLGTEDDADVINLSFGTIALPWNWYYARSPIDEYSALFGLLLELFEALREEYGIAVVVAAGNGGPHTMTVSPFCYTAVCAGSVSPQAGGVVSSFSSRGPDPLLRPSPQYLAPGDLLELLLPLEFASDTTTASGTSFSAPFVAGSLALLRQAFPDAPVQALEGLLAATSTATPDWDGAVKGVGSINVAEAYNAGVSVFFSVEGFARPQSYWPTAALWPGDSVSMKIVNLGAQDVTLSIVPVVHPTLLAPAPGEPRVEVQPSIVTVPAGGSVEATITFSEPGAPGTALLELRLVSGSGATVARGFATLVSPLRGGDEISIELPWYDWGFIPIPLEGQPGVYSLDVYTTILPAMVTVWSAGLADVTPSTVSLAGRAIAYVNPIPLLTALPLAETNIVTVRLSTVTALSLDELEARVSLLEASLQALEARVASIEEAVQRIGLLESQLEELEAELKAVEERLQALEASDEQQWRAIGDIEAWLASIEESIASIRAEIEEARRAFQGLSERVDGLQARIEALEKGLADAKNDILRLREDLRVLRGRVASLEGRVDGVNVAVEELGGRLGELEGRVYSVEASIQEAHRALAELQVSLEETRAAIARLEHSATQAIEELRASLRTLHGELERLSLGLGEAKSVIEEVYAKLGAAERRLERAEAALEELLAASARLEESLERLDGRIASAEKGLELLSRSLEDASARIRALQVEIEALQSEVAGVRSRQAQLEEALARQGGEGVTLGEAAAAALGLLAALAAAALLVRRIASHG